MSKIHDLVTARILDALKEGKVPWRKPWKAMRASGNAQPHNIKGRPYRGANWFLLGMMPYEDPTYLTFKQALELGGCVRKGEHGIPVIFWKLLDGESEDGGPCKIPFARQYTVFNVAQCDGLPAAPEEPLLPTPPAFDPIMTAEAIWDGFPNKPGLLHGGDRALYSPQRDQIWMPKREAFETPEGYYETLFHEAGHSTGHQSRLNRKEIVTASYFGAKDYSREELVAELTAAFLCAAAGIDQPVFENMVAYLQGWMSRLKEEPDAFITAASRAQRAMDYILGKTFEDQPEVAA